MREALVRFLPGAGIVLAALLPSSSPYIGDTASYARSVIEHRAGTDSVGLQPLWEFGHLLWRPLGAVLAPVSLALVPDSWNADERVKVAFGFLAVSIVAALAIGALCFDLVRRYAGWKVATLLTFGLSWANGFLMYSLSGASYILALFWSMLAVWLLVGDPQNRWHQAVAGLSGALAALFWFPFILTIPALVVLAGTWLPAGTPTAPRVRAALRVAVTAAAAVAFVYVVSAFAAGVRSPADAMEWYRSASHGWVQTQQWKRAVTGVARLMLDLSRDGILLKRYVLSDPFQSLTLFDLVRQSLWKLAAFYLFVASVAWMGMRTPTGRKSVGVALVALVPLLLFALILFEPSSPERFLPIIPFMFLVAATSWHGWGRRVAGAFLLSLPLLNGRAFIERWSSLVTMSVAQMQDVSASVPKGDLIVTVTFADPFPQWVEQRLYHPSLRNGAPPTYQIVAPAEVTAARWRGRFASRVLRHWQDGANVWIRRGALEDRPDEMLQWVEGDQPSLHWADITTFLRQFDYDSTTARPDGFTRLAPTERTRAALMAIGSSDRPS